MQSIKDINFDELVQNMHVLYPDLPQSENFNKHLRTKLEEQIKEKVPKVEIEHLDLKYIILNVKKSLSEFQKRIDDSIVQQQLRRTARVRKTISQDPSVVSFFNTKQLLKMGSSPPSTSAKTDTDQSCLTRKCCHQLESDLVGLVQVESLPVSASTNLVTIFVPSILQEKLHCCKYKISIDLNRLDLTKKILDLNVSHLEPYLNENNSNIVGVTVSGDQKCKVTYEIKDNNDVQLVGKQTEYARENSPRIEIKSPTSAMLQPSLEPIVSIVKAKAPTSLEPNVSIVEAKDDDILTTTKKRPQKRKDPQALPNHPPKKRGRKPGSKNKVKTEKSELARYVEMFECNGNSPSAVSQIVTSTTQNWDVLPDQTGQIAYFMNGQWTLCSPTIGHPIVSTTTAAVNLGDATGNETFIPFEDFVNFIDNPSLDVGNNVIARVLDGTDNPDNTLHLEEPTKTMTLGLETIKSSKSVENAQTMHFSTKTAKTFDSVNIDSADRNTSEAINYSSENNSNVLDLTRRNVDDPNSSSSHKKTSCNPENNNVIFSTCRSMPSLDDEEADLFCSTPQTVKSSDNNIIAFSMIPKKSQLSDFNNSFLQRENTIADSGIEVDRKETYQSSDSSEIGDILKNTTISTKANVNGEVIKGMSLLEIEKDFDDSLLEFGNYLDDDLLSLAPSSCFKTPADDRFADSILLDIGEPEIKLCANSCTSLNISSARSHLETGLLNSDGDGLPSASKKFRIPKMKPISERASSERSLEQLPRVKRPYGPMDYQNTSTTNVSSTILPTVHKSLSHYDSLKMSNVSEATSQMMSTLDISKIFGSLCFKFLSDACFESTCKLSHQLLDVDIISLSVSFLRNEVLHSAYKFIWRHYKLFKCYFPIFCVEYGRRNMRQKLSTMVRDCELQPKCLLFLRNIYSSMTDCGFGKVNACRFVFSRVRDRSHMAIDILLALIIDSDAQMFASAIEQFSKVRGYKFTMKSINELAAICLRSGSAELVPVLIKCLINIDQTEFLTLRSPELIELLEIIKNGS